MLFVRWDPDPSASVQGTSTGTVRKHEWQVPCFRNPQLWDERERALRFSSVLVLSRTRRSTLTRVLARSRARVHSDSRNCQRQRKLLQPLMVFERGRSDAKDVRTHAGQITILPLSRQTGYFRLALLLPFVVIVVAMWIFFLLTRL